MHYPIETGNIILIILGAALIVSGPIIVYRTLAGVRKLREQDPQASPGWFNNGINIVIAILFFFAGILFILNNLRGNPLS